LPPETLMPPRTLSLALKEWAVTQRALLEGHQIILLRKGGLVEDTGDFDLRAPTFLLYPTYEHETERAGDLQPCFAQWLAEEEQGKPGPGFARLEAWAEATDVVRVAQPETLIRLMPQHIWSRQFLQGRFDWEPYKPVFALVLRAHRLAAPQTLPMRREYGGCRSWIDLAEPISIEGSTPAVSDDTWARRRALTLQLLAE